MAPGWADGGLVVMGRLGAKIDRMTRLKAWAAAAASAAVYCCSVPAAYAAVPDAYHPLVVVAPASETERVFDITAAIERAKSERKPVYLYLGAEDCGPCKVYSKFLLENEAELIAEFRKVVLVDVRTSIKGPAGDRQSWKGRLHMSRPGQMRRAPDGTLSGAFFIQGKARTVENPLAT